MNVELGIVLYNTMVLSIVSSLSYLIATSIDFIKNPTDDIFQMSLDRVGYAKTTQSMLYNDLRKFNISCKKGEVDKTLDMLLSQRGARAIQRRELSHSSPRRVQHLRSRSNNGAI